MDADTEVHIDVQRVGDLIEMTVTMTEDDEEFELQVPLSEEAARVLSAALTSAASEIDDAVAAFRIQLNQEDDKAE